MTQNQIKAAIQSVQYNKQARALTRHQLTAMLQVLNLPEETLIPIALLVLKAQGQAHVIDLLKKDNKSQLESLAERRIKSLTHNSWDPFKNLLQLLEKGFTASTNSSSTKLETNDWIKIYQTRRVKQAN